jgi:LmbE family N-acetylglucosaminyl deacetylase
MQTLNKEQMENSALTRRKFVFASALGLGGFAVAPHHYPTAHPAEGSLSGAGLGRSLKIVCVGAHPGDPEFGCGGTMALYSNAGHQVTLLYLTRGEAGDPSKSYAESAGLRTKEAESSCSILKAKPLFAGQIDGNSELNGARNESMTRLILGEKPDIVFTHWPLDSHVDHQVAGLLTLTAWIKSGKQFHLYFYEVNTGSETMGFEPSDYVDITAVRDTKKAAMFAHQTQNPKDVYDGFFRAMEDFRGLEAGVKAAEGFIHFKPKTDRAILFGL